MSSLPPNAAAAVRDTNEERVYSSESQTPASKSNDDVFDPETFTNDLLKIVKAVPDATDPFKSSEVLRTLIRSGILKYTDMQDAPEKFFLAHRLLATVGLGGFGIRFTVQYNLFAGSIVGLAGPKQLSVLDELSQSGALGCFLLTEMQAGVLSGLIVRTTATYDSESSEFVLHTPDDAAAKNWISQGYTAELGVVIADLVVDGKSHGPHPFYMKLRESKGGNLVPGVRIEDMGGKTVANDLDNARVWFDNVRLPKDALLNRFADVVDHKYVQVGEEPMRIEVIGQRLLTGRQCISEAALIFSRVLHMKTEGYAKSKMCNGLAGETSLASMPQLANVLRRNYEELDAMIGFTAEIEDRLCKVLRSGTIPDDDLVDAIAVCKIRGIEVAIECIHRLRLEVGSYALTSNTGFDLMDMFLCCKFAEGDSRILQMKLSRDRLKRLKKDGVFSTVVASIMSDEAEESRTALSLARKLAPAGRDMKKMSNLMTEHWEEFYALADHVADRIIRETPKGAFLEPVVERIQPFSRDYDKDWKIHVGVSE